VNHINNVRISGCDQCEYYDGLDVNEKNEWPLKTQQGDIIFFEEVDKVYQSLNTPSPLTKKTESQQLHR
tara:strand:+ start:429 stop:635 length:207 start_codon:yes stop_codon:yes gene_type:complete